MDSWLMVTTNGGVEATRLLPAELAHDIHLRQAPSDRRELELLVGPNPDCGPSTAAGDQLVGIVPKESSKLERAYPLVVAHSGEGFEAWAAAVIDHLARSLMVPGLIGLDFASVRDLFSQARRFGFVFTEGAATVETLIRQVLEDEGLNRSTGVAFLAIVGTPTMTIQEVILVTDAFAAAHPHARMLLYAATLAERQVSRVSILFAR